MATFEDYGLKVTKRSGHCKTTCPKCSHERKEAKDPCVWINVVKGIWRCFHCGWHGTLGYGKTEKPKKIYQKPAYQPKDISPKALEWLMHERKIPKTVIDEMKITVNEKNWLLFPYFEGELLVDYQLRNWHKKDFRQAPNTKKIYYNLNALQNSTEIIICEGMIDVLSFMAAGIKNVISVPQGAPNANADDFDAKFEFVSNCEDYFDFVDKIYLAVDNDPNGHKLKDELARRYGKDRCWIIEFPEGCKDANDVLRKDGAEALMECYRSAKPFPVDKVQPASHYFDKADLIFNHGFPHAALIGMPDTDSHVKFIPGFLATITGVPGFGKSSWLDFVMAQLALKHGWKHLIFTAEKLQELHILDLAKMLTAKGWDNRFPAAKMTEDQYQKAKEWIRDRYFYFDEADGMLDVDKIIEAAKLMVMREGIRCIGIDCWNRLDLQFKKGDNETNAVKTALSKLSNFCKTHEVLIILVAHPQKPSGGYKKGEWIPEGYDISGSAHFYNMTDYGLTIHYDGDCKVTTLKIWKSKLSGITGRTGVVEYLFDMSTNRYRERAMSLDMKPYIEIPDTESDNFLPKFHLELNFDGKEETNIPPPF